MTQPDPAIVRAVIASNRPRLMATLKTLQALTTPLDINRKALRDALEERFFNAHLGGENESR